MFVGFQRTDHCPDLSADMVRNLAMTGELGQHMVV